MSTKLLIGIHCVLRSHRLNMAYLKQSQRADLARIQEKGVGRSEVSGIFLNV